MPDITIDESKVFETSRSSTRGTATLLPDPEPRETWCPIISVDDHVLEPPELFVTRMPASMRDAAPHVEYDGEEVPYWVFDDLRLPILPTDGAVGRPVREWNRAPQKYEEFRRAVWDPATRLLDMDLNGTWASLGFSSFNFGFAGSRFTRLRDRAVGYAALQAYNDWMVDEWCGAAPDRFIACQMSWLGDPELAAAEIRRNAARRARGLVLREPGGARVPVGVHRPLGPVLRRV